MEVTIQQLRAKVEAAKAPLDKSSAINDLVNELRKTKQYEESNELLNESLRLAKSAPDSEDDSILNIARALNLRSITLRHQGDYSQALTVAHDSLHYYEKLGNIEQQAHLYNNIGNILAHLGRSEDSLQAYFHALELSESIENPQGIQMSLGNIGILFASLDELDGALDYFDRALSIALQSDLKNDSASHLCNIGNVYRKLGNYALASENYHRALKVFEDIGDQFKIAALMGNIGTVCYHGGEYDEAYQYLNQALASAEELKDFYGVALWRSNLGELFSQEDWSNFNLEIAEKHLLEALSPRSQTEAFVDQYWIHKLLGNVYKSQHRWEEALYHTERYHTLKEEVQCRNALQSVADTDAKRKIALMNKEKEIIDAKNAELELANTLKTKLLGIAAHDLKNPLGNIIGFVRMLVEEIPAPSEHHEMLVMINESAASMHRLIIDLLESSAAELGVMTLDRTPINLSEIVRIVIYSNLMAANAKSQRIESCIEDVSVNADSQRLLQVLENLVSNAIKYSPIGKPINIRLYQNKTSARIEVQDHGQGLTEEDMSKLFGHFQRLSAQPTGGESSTGLGLSIVKQIVELHGGRIWAESAGKNLGATFIVELPTS